MDGTSQDSSPGPIEGISARTLPALIWRGLATIWRGVSEPVESTGGGPAAVYVTWSPVFQLSLTALVLGAVGGLATEVPSVQMVGAAMAIGGAVTAVVGFVVAAGVGSLGVPPAYADPEAATKEPGLRVTAEGVWTSTREAGPLSRTLVVLDVGGPLLVVATADPHDEDVAAVQQLGEIGWVLAPSAAWIGSAQAWRRSLPGVVLVVPAGVSAGEGATVLAVGTQAPWPSGTVSVERLPAGEGSEELVLLHQPSQTLVVADAMVHLPPGGAATGWAYRLAMMVGRPGPDLTTRLHARDRKGLGLAVSRIARWPFERIVLAHGRPVLRSARGVFIDAFAFVTG